MFHLTPFVRPAAVLAAALMLPQPALAQDMPPSARAIVAKLKIAPDLLQGWAAEQKVPGDWLAGARKEAALSINGSWSPKEFDALAAPFRERYPFIEINYNRASNRNRVRVPLIAFKEGRITTDIITGIDSSINQFRAANALADLSDMPNLANIPAGMGSRSGHWAGIRVRYWCLGFNPTLIKPADMPKKWEDILTHPQLRDGRLALWRGAVSWMLPLWGEKGEVWTKDFARRLFSDVKPQRRKEGARALVALVVAGEFNATLAAAAYQVRTLEKKGAPAAFHCPDVVPVSISSVGVLANNPHLNASKLFMNWLLSKEGQLAQYAADGAPPVHKDLIGRGFMAYPAAIEDKKMAFRNPELLDDELKALLKFWNPLWQGGEAKGG
jgi:iron(III) transport system substrate-binding protein